jgi:vancomycin resistance protein YoaR
VTDFDDFDWVDSTSRRGRREDGPSGIDQPREYKQPHDTPRSDGSTPPGVAARPNNEVRRPRGSAPSRAPIRGGGPVRAAGSSQNRNRRTPKKTIWSQLGSWSKTFFKKIASLPKPVLIGVAALAFIVVLTMVIDSAAYYNKVHTGVSMGGQGLGGSTYDQAVELVNQKTEEMKSQPVTLVKDSQTWTITPDQLGQLIDPDASVTAAMQVTRKSNLIADLAKRLALYFDHDNLPLIGTIDEEKLDAFIQSVASTLDINPTNQGLSIQGDSIEVVQGVNGIVVDRDELKRLLKEALFAHNTAQVRVPMVVKGPDVVADESEEAKNLVRTMISDDVTLAYYAPPTTVTTTPTTVGGQTTATTAKPTTTTVTPQQTTTTTVVETSAGSMAFVWKTKTFSPEEIKDLIGYKTENRSGVKVLVPYISPEKLGNFFASIEGPMTVPAADARFDTDGSTPFVVAHKQGKGLDHQATAAAMTRASLAASDRVAEAELKDIDPEFTTEDANAMGINTNLGEWTEVWAKGIWQREWNVRLTTAKIANTSVTISGTNILAYGSRLIAPGEEFSFSKTVGPRTEKAGFLGAGGIVDGRIETDVLGGGICQVSTALFNALLNAGLKITERWNHSIFIDHYPSGKDATVTGGGEPKDLKFINDTPNYLWLYGTSDGKTTRFVIFGTSDQRKVTTLTTSAPYEVKKRTESTVTVLDATLLWGSTSVAFTGQDEFKLKLTRVISWPNGSTTSETWISQWGIKPKIVAFPTSSTISAVPGSPTTATTLAGTPGS